MAGELNGIVEVMTAGPLINIGRVLTSHTPNARRKRPKQRSPIPYITHIYMQVNKIKLNKLKNASFIELNIKLDYYYKTNI